MLNRLPKDERTYASFDVSPVCGQFDHNNRTAFQTSVNGHAGDAAGQQSERHSDPSSKFPTAKLTHICFASQRDCNPVTC